ncbi:hypothetical protein WA158_001152 [Blastocystis sp. Blastoise]
MAYIVDIVNPKETPSVSTLGGKGSSLAKLSAGNFPVPDGFVITTSGYEAFAEKLNLVEKYSTLHLRDSMTLEEADSISEEIKALFRSGSFPEEYKDDLLAHIERMRNDSTFDINLLAVRSSATTEDLADASFAGMHDTIINVKMTLKDIKEAVIECWASLYTPRAILYRFEKKFPIIDTAIAVVIQRMIPSEKSGVIFSCDPQTSSREHIALDGILGLGEALVSGMVSADHWTIRKHFPVSKKQTELRITDRIINEQEFALYTKPQGGTEKKYLNEKGKKPAFTDKEIYGISQYSADVEKYYGKPMDMEFCIYKDKIYIVQARPITTLLDLPEDMDPLSPNYKYLYHNCLGYQYVQLLNKPWNYLSYSCYNNIFFKNYNYFRWIGGFPFIEINHIVANKTFENILVTLFGRYEDKEIAYVYYLLLGWFIIFIIIIATDEWYKNDLCYFNKGLSTWPFMKHFLSFIGSHLGSYIWNYYLFFSPKRLCYSLSTYLNNCVDKYNQILEDVRSNDNTKITLRSLQQDDFCFFKYFDDNFVSLFSAAKAKILVLNLLKKYNMGSDELQSMCEGREQNLAAQLNYKVSIFKLQIKLCDNIKHGFRQNLDELVEDEDEKGIFDLFNSLETSSIVEFKELSNQWLELMDTFGRRGTGEILISNPRFIEKPSILIGMALNTSFKNTDDKSPRSISIKADEAVDEICSSMSSRDASKLRYYLPLVRLIMAYREHHKYIGITIIYAEKILIQKIAKRMIKEHIIQKEDEIYNFSLEELCDYDEGKLDIHSIQEKLLYRKNVYTKAFSMSSPRLIVSPFAACINLSQQTQEEIRKLPNNILKGMPTSAGIVEGKAVVVTDPKNAHLKKGDILIAESADPGWTPLFVPASGAVIAVGGPLTHGSIVAREMGIPCVVNVTNAMQKIHTGMNLRVDGTKGIVEILSE